MKIKPLGARVLILPVKEAEKTKHKVVLQGKEEWYSKRDEFEEDVVNQQVGQAAPEISANARQHRPAAHERRLFALLFRSRIGIGSHARLYSTHLLVSVCCSGPYDSRVTFCHQ